MTNDLKRLLAVLGTVTLISSAFLTIFYDNDKAKLIMAVLVAVSIPIALLVPHIAPLRLRLFDAFKVVAVEHAAEVQEIWERGQATYRAMRQGYPPEELLINWWRANDRGLFKIVDREGRLCMCLSVWPIAEETYLRLRSGEIDESELGQELILPPRDAPFEHFYIADFYRPQRAKSWGAPVTSYLKAHLVAAYLTRMRDEKLMAAQPKFVAHAASGPGRALLKALDFQPGRKSATLDIWYRVTDRQGIRAEISRCLQEMSANYEAARLAAMR